MKDPWIPYSRGWHADPVRGAPALLTESLVVTYPGASCPALRGVSVRVSCGTCAALVGPNGSGKSTFLKAVAGLLPVASGAIRVHGNPVGACHHRVAYLPQRGEIDWGFPISVERLVLTGRYVHLGWLAWPGRRDRQIATAVLERLGLDSLAGQQIGKLSGGQQQRALLARALAQEADLLLLDEPSNGVDARTQETIYDAMRSLRNQGKTLVVATHDLTLLDGAFGAVVRLRDGEVETDSSRNGVAGKERAWTG
ncbi:MAG: ABC transporter ATP-binding protein [Planctomycetes bacterium]|nr:ABC transporter ATP-binding protein [Planctomycetota bacterium]